MATALLDLPDLAGRPDIERLVNHFYTRVQKDPLLGPIFNDIAKTDWEHHLPKMYAFWQMVLFREGGFHGNPLLVHAALVPKTPMDWPRFERWLELFHASIDQLFAGERAEHLKRVSEDMAHVIHSRINGVVDRRFDPARLSAEQRARYAAYRDDPTG